MTQRDTSRTVLPLAPQVSILFYGFWSHPRTRNALLVLSLLAACLGSRATRSKDQTERAAPLACLLAARWLALCLRVAGVGAPCTSAVRTYVGMEALLFVGGCANALFLPERFCPGKLDFGPNSHNIMHIMTAATAVCLMRALRADFGCMAAAGGV